MRGLVTKYIRSRLSNSLLRQLAEMSRMSEASPLYTMVKYTTKLGRHVSVNSLLVDKLPLYYIFLAVK